MSCPDKGRDLFLPVLAGEGLRCIGPDPAAAREIIGGLPLLLPRIGKRGIAVRLLDTGNVEFLDDAARAIAPARQCGAARRGEGRVVDIAQGGHPLDQRIDRGRTLIVPPALAELAFQIRR